MQTDLYTKAVLTVIAIAVSFIAIKFMDLGVTNTGSLQVALCDAYLTEKREIICHKI